MPRLRRLALPLISGLGLAVALVACGDDTSSNGNCGPGTVLQNGVCVPDNTTDTFTGGDAAVTDTNTTTQPPTDTSTNPGDTGGGQDTAQPTDTFVPNECTPEENSKLDVGAACSKDCQCRQDLGITCMSFSYYLPGFQFCTKPSNGTLSDLDGHLSLLFPSACYDGTPQSQRPPLYQKQCQTLDDCKALASQYTHCGTEGLPFHSGGTGTQCQNDVGASSGTLHTRKTCVIDSLLPFASP